MSLRATTMDFSQQWEALEVLLHQVVSKPMTMTSATLVSMYNAVYRLTSNSTYNIPEVVARPRDISDVDFQLLTVRHLLTSFIEAHLLAVRKNVSGYDMALISSYLAQWEQFCFTVKLLTIGFAYAHRMWKQNPVTAHNQPTDTGFIASQLWVEVIVTPLRGTLTQSLLAQLRLDRDGDPIERNLIRLMLLSLANLTHSFSSASATGSSHGDRRLSVYVELFEAPYLAETEAHYESVAADFLATNDIREYISRVRRVLSAEGERSKLLHPSSASPLKRVIVNVLIERRLQQLISDAPAWIDRHETAVLDQLFYILQHNENCLDPLRRLFEERIDYNGKMEIQRVAADVQKELSMLIPALLQVYHTFHELLTRVFREHKAMRQAFLAGMTKVVNANAATECGPGGKVQSSRAAEALAKYCNQLLRTNSSLAANVTDQHVFDAHLHDTLRIFALLEERDVFQSYYAFFMANRLIYGQFNEERELLVMQRFKEMCGHEFTYKWQRMFNDAVLNLGQKFAEHLAERDQPPRGLDLNPMVLTSGSWPNAGSVFEQQAMPQVTPELQRTLDQFVGFYRAAEKGKRLMWMPAFGHGVVRNAPACNFERQKQYDLTVSQYQLCFLNLFNVAAASARERGGGDPLVSFADFAAAASTENTQQCVRQLQPLLRAKLIVAAPAAAAGDAAAAAGDVTQQTFRINAQFFAASRKLALLPAPASFNSAGSGGAAGGGDTDHVQQKVRVDRKFAIQAAIVRLMKSRRTMLYQELVNETFNLLRHQFAAQVPQIKENVEVLIEKEYIERSVEDPNRFNYLA